MNLKDLHKPFPAEDVEWRSQKTGVSNNKPWTMVLCYITNRAIMDRLDEVCGPENWKNHFETGPGGGILCGISIKIDGEWVTKWDGAENTQVEAIKGGLSSAMKRAGVPWGIGRYLYKLDATFAECDLNEKKYQNRGYDTKSKVRFSWKTPELPAWALPDGKKSEKKKEPKPTEEPMLLSQFKKIVSIAGETFTDDEVKKVVESYAKLNGGKTFELGEDIIKNWDSILDKYMEDNQ